MRERVREALEAMRAELGERQVPARGGLWLRTIGLERGLERALGSDQLPAPQTQLSRQVVGLRRELPARIGLRRPAREFQGALVRGAARRDPREAQLVARVLLRLLA